MMIIHELKKGQFLKKIIAMKHGNISYDYSHTFTNETLILKLNTL